MGAATLRANRAIGRLRDLALRLYDAAPALDYGELGDVARELRELGISLERGCAVEHLPAAVSNAHCLLSALIDSSRATRSSTATVADLLDGCADDAEFELECGGGLDLPPAPAEVSNRAAAAIRDVARAIRRRHDFFGDPLDVDTADYLEHVAGKVDIPVPPAPGNVVPFARHPRPGSAA